MHACNCAVLMRDPSYFQESFKEVTNIPKWNIIYKGRGCRFYKVATGASVLKGTDAPVALIMLSRTAFDNSVIDHLFPLKIND